MEGESSGQRNGKEVSIACGMEVVLADLENQPEPIQKIYRVPDHVRQKAQLAYEPKKVCIGAYNHLDPLADDMGDHKRRARDKLVEVSKLPIEHYKVEMMKVVKIVRDSYPDLKDYELRCDEDFIDMTILDGCFLIAFLSEPLNGFRNYPTNDTMFSERGHAFHFNTVMEDLLMAENQLPYLVLQILLTTSGQNADAISQWLRPGVKKLGFHILDTYMGGLLELGAESSQCTKREVGLCASELYQFSVRFKKASSYTNIKFDGGSGMLTLPVLVINKHSYSTYLNMVARALTQQEGLPTANIFTIYARLLGTLVKSTKDLRLLESHGIIINEMINDGAAVKIIEKIALSTFSSENIMDDVGLSYNSVQEDLDKFCQKKRMKLKKTLGLWLSDLSENHFKSPWTGLSIFAAVILLALTAAQTYYAVQSYKFAVLSYKKQP